MTGRPRPWRSRLSPRRRARDRSRFRARHLLLGCAGLLLVGAGWLLVTGLLARSELLAAQRELETARQSVITNPDESRTALSAAAEHAARARVLTTGPAWFLADALPVLGDPAETVRGAAYAADRLTRDVLPPLVRLASDVEGDTRDGEGLGTLLSRLRHAAPDLERAARATEEVRATVEALPRTSWLPTADARAELVRQVDRLTTATDDAAMAARLLPPMLGDDGPRRYFMVFQNTAESRGTGGMPGAFAVFTADHGALSFEHFGTGSELSDSLPAIELGAEFDAQYGASAPTRVWANSNLSPHFPNAARIWAATWQEHSGQRVDGVIALDPTGLGRLLDAAGPARLPDGTALTGETVSDLVLRTAYDRFQDDAERQTFLLDVARTAAATLTGALEDGERLPTLFEAGADVLGEERLKVWSALRDEQLRLETRSVSGILPEGPGPFAGLVVNNAAGGKLDYYLERRLRWTPGSCTALGRSVTVEITLSNTAPQSGLPAYVTQRGDNPDYPTQPGDNRLLVSYYASSGAVLTGAELDGRPITAHTGVERGHPVLTMDLELPAQSTQVLTLHLVEPVGEEGDRPPVLLRQPLVTPMPVTVDPYPVCG
ncbi:DUF4012 domain-containing protein [Streptomyces sp. 8K308]|uniref:DUF4012 domain-containing protein n=1 Tax=Streptomyces sp. 8K308 TaxID=2530388 RepID=UPI001404303B|nr:DUF4012 domain-containing protein [Streptomyces sp. 8K308]